MGLLINCKDHFSVHVLEIRPESIEGNVVLLILFNNGLDLLKSAISPPALVVTKAPEGRNVSPSDIVVISLKHFLRILLSQDDEKVDISAD